LNDGTRQRLVGAVVLAALALILWPVVMGPKRDQSFVIESDIPARPVFGASEIKQPEPRVDVSPIGEYQQKLKQQSEQAQRGGATEREPPAQAAAVEPPAVTQPALDKDGVPIGWIIQVASFGERENANALSKRLQDNGYRAHVKVQGKYARVFVGPYIDQAMAQKDMGSIARNHQTKPKLVRFSP
jgi:DedD protein